MKHFLIFSLLLGLSGFSLAAEQAAVPLLEGPVGASAYYLRRILQDVRKMQTLDCSCESDCPSEDIVRAREAHHLLSVLTRVANKTGEGWGSSMEDALFTEFTRYRRHAGERFCTCYNASVAENGGWCNTEQPLPIVENGVWQFGNPLPTQKSIPFFHVSPDTGLAMKMAEVIRKEVGPAATVCDFGAGVGQYGSYFKVYEPKMTYLGFDGAENTDEYTGGFVKYFDLTEPLEWQRLNISKDGEESPAEGSVKCDFVICLEVGEHIPQQFESMVMQNLVRFAHHGLILTWAKPDQLGHSHVNLRTREYIVDAMSQRGMDLDEEVAQSLSDSPTMWPWFQGGDRVMFFRKTRVFES